VVGGWCVAVRVGVVIDGPWVRAGEVDLAVCDVARDEVAGQDVADQFWSDPIDAAVSVGWRDAGGEVPQPLPLALVGTVVASGTDLRQGTAGLGAAS